MKTLGGGLVTVMAAGVLAIVPAARTRVTQTVGPRDTGVDRAPYASSVKEFYLTADQLEQLRPGLQVTVNSVSIDGGLHPVVDVSYTDDLGRPLDRAGVITAGPIAMSFVLAWWDAGTRNYTSYTTRVQTSPITHVAATQAAADSGGTWEDIDLGHSIYTFKTALPVDYDRGITTTLGIYATRATTEIIGKNYYANLEYDFVPDGHAVTQVWDMIPQAACNTCHNPLSAHGGARQDVKLCALCHSPQTVDPDTGNTVDLKVMIHKIHMGEDLPSVQAGVPYQIVGFGNNVVDFSHILYPQDIRRCATCHAPPATQAANWYTYPERASCASCHDQIDWVTGENHPAGPQATDANCASCHRPVGDREWDASIQGAHTVPDQSTQLQGINAEIVSVTGVAPGQMPTIRFRLFENDGTPLDPASFGSNLNVLMGGPTADYAVNPFRERADAAAFDGTTATYTFSHAIPADATGTWAFSIEARRTVPLDPAPFPGATFTEAAMNPVAYAAVDGGVPQPRRAVVDLANCNGCHGRLALHGGQRLNTEECVICHNPNASDVARRPAEALPVESVDFKRMIHRIHTGEELTQIYTVYGFGGTPINFNEVVYPGDRRDCLRCHLPGTAQVFEPSLPSTLLPTTTLRDWYTPQQHNAASCLGCHDSLSSAAHAFTNTAPFAEACAACHGNSAEFSVDKVHAR